MTLRDDVRQHVSRLGLERDYLTDGPSKMQITLASQLMNVVEAAMTDAGVRELTRRQVLDRVLYGGMPSRAETESRHQLLEQRRVNLSRGMPGLIWDEELRTFLGPGGGAPDGCRGATGHGAGGSVSGAGAGPVQG